MNIILIFISNNLNVKIKIGTLGFKSDLVQSFEVEFKQVQSV